MSQQAVNCYVLDITDDENNIAAQLRNVVNANDKIDAERLLLLVEESKKSEAAVAMHGEKIAKRAGIYERARQRTRAKELEYSRARDRANAARTRLVERTSRQAKAKEEQDAYKFEMAAIKRRLKESSELYEGDAFEKRALMLKFITEMIDTSEPIRVTTTNLSTHSSRRTKEQRVTVSWRSNDIQIKDGFGGVLPYNFGKFNVQVHYFVKEGGNYVEVNCLITDPSTRTRRIEYYHPHLNANGRACLGNLAPLLLKFMGEKDIVSVVEHVTVFLQHYNEHNPYVKLETWCPNRWDSRICESGQHILADCHCQRCNVCNGIVEDEALSSCGSCASCCMVNHIYMPNIEGINNTHCISREDYHSGNPFSTYAHFLKKEQGDGENS